MTKSKLQQMTSRWMEEGKYGRVIDELEKTPIAKRGAKLTVVLAQARIRRYGLGDQEDPKAPAGWKEKTIRELEYFKKDPSPEWQEAMANLKGLPYEPPAPPKQTTPPPAAGSAPARTPKPSSGGKKNSSAAGSAGAAASAPTRTPPPSSGEKKGPSAAGAAGGTSPPQGGRSLDEIKAIAKGLLLLKKYREFLKLLESVEIWKVDVDLLRLLIEGLIDIRQNPDLTDQAMATTFHLMSSPDPEVRYYANLLMENSPEEALNMVRSADKAFFRRGLTYHLKVQFWKLQDPGTLRRHGLRPLPKGVSEQFAMDLYPGVLEQLREETLDEGNRILTYVATVLEQYMVDLNLDANGEPNQLETTTALLHQLPPLLRSMEEQGQNIPLWHVAWAGIHALDNEPRLSMQSWKRASELDPEDESLRTLVAEWDEESQRIREETESWRRDVERMWSSFREKERDIYEVFLSGERVQGENLLDDALPGLVFGSFWAYLEGKKVHIVFSYGDRPDLLFELNYFCSRMPEEYQDRWAFHPFMRKWIPKMGSPVDWEISTAIGSKSRKLVLTISPNPEIDFSDLSRKDFEKFARFEVRWEIGELNMRHIDTVKVLHNPARPGTAHPLNGLRAEMEKMGFQMVDDFRSWERSAPVMYRLSGGKEARKDLLRGDILYGANLFSGFATAPHNWDQEVYRRWTGHHIIPGFFYIPVGGLITEQRHLALSLLEHVLTEHTDPSLYQTLGWAIGKEYVYVDVLVWDLPSLLQAAKSCTKYHLTEGLLFHRFNVNSAPIVVKDWTPPKE